MGVPATKSTIEENKGRPSSLILHPWGIVGHPPSAIVKAYRGTVITDPHKPDEVHEPSGLQKVRVLEPPPRLCPLDPPHSARLKLAGRPS
jgi:hypothetical protein